MTLHIGVVGCSAEGAALCYRTICTEGEALLGMRYAHPEVTMHTHSFADYVRCFDRDDWKGVADLMLSSTAKVAGAGASFAITPDNTIHRAFDLVAERSPIPWLHIAEEVAGEAKRLGYRRLAVLGTRLLMESAVYPSRLEPLGIEHAIPSADERGRIDTIIFDELVYGATKEDSLRYFAGVIERMQGEGCDAVVLGCTEIPLLVTPDSSPLPTLDSTRILARAALRRAVGTHGGK